MLRDQALKATSAVGGSGIKRLTEIRSLTDGIGLINKLV